MEIRVVPASEIKPAPYNPRKRLSSTDPEYQSIKRSLDRFGLVDPLVWNKRTGNLVGGHQRFHILCDEGIDKFEVSVVDLPDEEERALNITLNNHHVGGAWDFDSLSALINEIESQIPDAYDTLEMSALLRDIDRESSDENEDASTGTSSTDKTGPPEMELLPYEHYDYVVLMFKDQRDFMAAVDHFKLSPCRPPAYTGSKKIGLGRVLDGAVYLARVRAGEFSIPPEGATAAATTSPGSPGQSIPSSSSASGANATAPAVDRSAEDELAAITGSQSSAAEPPRRSQPRRKR